MGKYRRDSLYLANHGSGGNRFDYRYMLVDGHFGSMDGDAAATVYKPRVSKIALEMLRDINKNTVDFVDNYDANEREPARFPNLLVNGAGIAVGMATNIPLLTLGEVMMMDSW